MDHSVASRFGEAAGGMMEAAELMWKASQLNAEIQGMVAENQDRESKGFSQAHSEEAFSKVLESYRQG